MEPSKRAIKIPENIWNKHRDTIEVLYLGERRPLEGKNGVLDIMDRLHGFNAR